MEWLIELITSEALWQVAGLIIVAVFGPGWAIVAKRGRDAAKLAVALGRTLHDIQQRQDTPTVPPEKMAELISQNVGPELQERYETLKRKEGLSELV